MFSALQKQFGTAGLLIAVVALVAALGGGAYAAAGGAGASKAKSSGLTKAQVLALIKKNQIAGSAGPAGPVGPVGPAGANGKDGGAGPPGPLLEVLPSGKTLKGAWGAAGGYEETDHTAAVATISFPVSLAVAPTLNYIYKEPQAGGTIFGLSISGDGTQILQLGEAEAKASCPGSSAEPKAKAGNLCMYASQETLQTNGAQEQSPISSSGFTTTPPYDQPTKFGANVLFRFFQKEGTVAGTWAVTAS